MAQKKKMTRHSSRFGSRYGVAVRKRFDLVENKQRKKHVCPKCGFERVKRISTGIFSCTKCHAKYAGGAYYPQTLSGSIVAKMVLQKAFNPALLEEVQVVEEVEAKPAKKAKKAASDEDKIDALTHAEEADVGAEE